MVGSTCLAARSKVPRAWPGRPFSTAEQIAPSNPPWGRTVAALVFAEHGRSEIPSVSEAFQLESGLEQRVSALVATDIVVLFSTQERPARSGPAVTTSESPT